MNNIQTYISELERQGQALDRAIAALRELDGPVNEPVHEVESGPIAPRKRHMSPEGRRAIQEAIQRRWAAVRAAKAMAAAGVGKRGARKTAIR